jgi:hypothetical protein
MIITDKFMLNIALSIFGIIIAILFLFGVITAEYWVYIVFNVCGIMLGVLYGSLVPNITIIEFKDYESPKFVLSGVGNYRHKVAHEESVIGEKGELGELGEKGELGELGERGE